MANGLLPPSTMKALPGFFPYEGHSNFLAASTTSLSNLVLPGVWTDAVNMAAAFRAHFGTDLVYAEAYRSLSMQQQRAREHEAGGPLAATPGTSNHGWGRAIDYRNNIGTITSAEYGWMAENASRFGFLRDVPSEGWHWTHPSDTALTTISQAGTGTVTPIDPEEDDMTPAQAKLLEQAAKDAHTAKNEAAQANSRAGKTYDLVKGLYDGKKGVGYLVWAFKLATSPSRRSASDLIRTIDTNTDKD